MKKRKGVNNTNSKEDIIASNTLFKINAWRKIHMVMDHAKGC